MKNYEGRTALSYAGNAKIASLFISHGASVDSRDEEENTILHHYAASGDVELVKIIVEKVIDVNAVNDSGETPLDFADDCDVRELLEKHGAKSGIK